MSAFPADAFDPAWPFPTDEDFWRADTNGSGKAPQIDEAPLCEGAQSPDDPGDASRVDRLWPAFLAELAAGGQGTVATGLPKLDELLEGGLPCGQVTLLVAPPGGFKTSFALHLARQHATRGHTAALWSRELPIPLVLARYVSQVTGAPWGKVIRGKAQPEDLEATGRALAGLPPTYPHLARPRDDQVAAYPGIAARRRLPPAPCGTRPRPAAGR